MTQHMKYSSASYFDRAEELSRGIRHDRKPDFSSMEQAVLRNRIRYLRQLGQDAQIREAAVAFNKNRRERLKRDIETLHSRESYWWVRTNAPEAGAFVKGCRALREQLEEELESLPEPAATPKKETEIPVEDEANRKRGATFHELSFQGLLPTNGESWADEG